MKYYYFAIKDMAVYEDGTKCEAYARIGLSCRLSEEGQKAACALYFRVSTDRVRIITKQEYLECVKEDE